MDAAADKDRPLKEDIRLLGRTLGDVLRAQTGEAGFARIEAIRQTAIRFRRADAGEASAATGATFRQLTGLSGVEQFPSLSPDGRWVVYAGEAEGNRDIYLQGVGGQLPINLTADSPAERRVAVPFSCVLMPWLGVALGVRQSHAARSRGVAVGLLSILVYYFLVPAGMTLVPQGVVSAPVALWAPNVLLLVAAFVAFRGVSARPAKRRRP